MKSFLCIIACFVLGVILASISGCAQITNGNVVFKQFVPEHEEEDITYTKVGDINIPITNYYTVPDQWFVTFGKEDEDGKYKERTMRVGQETYDEFSEGDWINFDEE